MLSWRAEWWGKCCVTSVVWKYTGQSVARQKVESRLDLGVQVGFVQISQKATVSVWKGSTDSEWLSVEVGQNNKKLVFGQYRGRCTEGRIGHSWEIERSEITSVKEAWSSSAQSHLCSWNLTKVQKCWRRSYIQMTYFLDSAYLTLPFISFPLLYFLSFPCTLISGIKCSTWCRLLFSRYHCHIWVAYPQLFCIISAYTVSMRTPYFHESPHAFLAYITIWSSSRCYELSNFISLKLSFLFCTSSQLYAHI